MDRLVPLTDRVLVATSEFGAATTTVVLGDADDCLIVDPGVFPGELVALRADLDRLGRTAAVAFATHPHWDHVLWADDLGPAPRYATAVATADAARHHDRILREIDELAPGHDPATVGGLSALQPGTTRLPWTGPEVRVVEHRAHAPGHAGLLVVADGVFLAGDMCSDVEMPLLDRDAPDPVGDYRAALDTFAALDDVQYVVPGHGSVGDATELGRRIAADRYYLDEFVAGRGDDDPRITFEWLRDQHDAQKAAFADQTK